MDNAKPDQRTIATAQPARSPLQALLKGVGAVAAVISLGMGIYQATRLIADGRERARHIAELSAIATAQQSNGDYAAAWSSLEQALGLAADSGQLAKLTGHLDQSQRELRIAQENLAMKWLRDAHVRDGETFTELVNRLTPALTRGELTASGVRKADVLAHLGWAAFLKSRDTGDTSAVAAYYQRALQVDPGNPFAHANAGHLLLWQHGSIEAAQQHFAAGLVTGRERAFVRRMQLAALKNSSLDEADASFVHVINDMRQSNESIDEDNRGALYSLYYFAVTRPSGLQHFVAAVPAAEQIATLRALFTGSDFEASKSPVRDASIATLLEFAGQSDEALATWRALQATFTPRDAGSVVALTNAAIKRLTPAHSAAKRR